MAYTDRMRVFQKSRLTFRVVTRALLFDKPKCQNGLFFFFCLFLRLCNLFNWIKLESVLDLFSQFFLFSIILYQASHFKENNL